MLMLASLMAAGSLAACGSSATPAGHVTAAIPPAHATHATRPSKRPRDVQIHAGTRARAGRVAAARQHAHTAPRHARALKGYAGPPGQYAGDSGVIP